MKSRILHRGYTASLFLKLFTGMYIAFFIAFASLFIEVKAMESRFALSDWEKMPASAGAPAGFVLGSETGDVEMGIGGETQEGVVEGYAERVLQLAQV